MDFGQSIKDLLATSRRKTSSSSGQSAGALLDRPYFALGQGLAEQSRLRTLLRQAVSVFSLFPPGRWGWSRQPSQKRSLRAWSGKPRALFFQEPEPNYAGEDQFSIRDDFFSIRGFLWLVGDRVHRHVVFVGLQNPVVARRYAGYRSPWTVIPAAARLISARSSAVSSTLAAPRFSSSRCS